MRFVAISEEDKALRLYNKPLRRCLSMHECCICNSKIKLGQTYYDGGCNKRAHEKCVKEFIEAPNKALNLRMGMHRIK